PAISSRFRSWNVSPAFQRVRIHCCEDHGAADKPIRVGIGAEIGEPVANHLEDEGAGNDAEKNRAAAAKQAHAADDHNGERGKLQPITEEGADSSVLDCCKDTAG